MNPLAAGLRVQNWLEIGRLQGLLEPPRGCSPWAAEHSAQGLTGWSFHVVGQGMSYSGSEAGPAKEHAYAKKTAQGEWMAGTRLGGGGPHVERRGGLGVG